MSRVQQPQQQGYRQEQRPAPQRQTQEQARLAEEIIDKSVKEIDDLSRMYADKLSGPVQSRLERMVNTARGVSAIGRALTDQIMDQIVMPLMNSDLGFKCDRPNTTNNTPYSREDVRPVIVVALLKGFLLTDNEFNIIAGRFYGAQAGYYRKLTEIEGLTDLEVIPGIPSTDQASGTIVRIVLKCKINGAAWELKDSTGKPGRVFPVRVNAGMGVDAIIGKAKRKAFKAAFEEITHTLLTDEDETETPTPPAGKMVLNGDAPAPSNGQSPPKVEENQDADTAPSPDGDVRHDSYDPPADASLTAEIEDELRRTGLAGTHRVDELARAAGAERFHGITSAPAEAMLAELRAMKDKQETVPVGTAPKRRFGS